VFEACRWLRAHAPVFEVTPGRFVITRYDDLREISRSPERFCSSRGILVTQDPADAYLGDGAQSILQMDPPTHVTYRKLVSHAFTPKAIYALEARVREIAHECLDALPATDGVDLVEHVAVPVPVLVIAELLGVPHDDIPTFRRLSDSVIEAADRGGLDGIGELLRFFTACIVEHQQHPRDDLISTLIASEVDGERLSLDELRMFCLTLLVAGNETTRNLISGGALAFGEHPTQWSRLVGDRSLLSSAVEETLRWVTPVMTFARTAVADTEVHGVELHAGDYLLLIYQSANRDERAFGPTADGFDVARTVDPNHLSFGFGEHYCLGASLARMEARVTWDAILERFSVLELAGEPEWLPSTLMNSLRRLPVALAAT
jgi:cytochrome P450